MNRIYQGKVTAVEIPVGKDEWKKLDDGESTLWQHHELFQDDVNYLLAAFATLVPTSCEDDIWKDYQAAIERSWESYTGRQGTWDRQFENACVIVGCKKDASFKEFRRKLNSLTGSKASEKQKFEALKQLFEPATEAAKKLKKHDEPVEESLKGKAQDLFGSTLVNLCAQKTKVTPRDVIAKQRNRASECTKKVNEGGRLKWVDVFYFKTDTSEAKWSREDAAKNIIQCLDKLLKEVQEKENDAKTSDQKKKMADLAERLEKQKKPLAAWCNNPKTELPTTEPTRKGSGGYDLKAAVLFSLQPDLDGFRDAFLLFNQARLKEEFATTEKGDAAYIARMAGGVARPLFPFFCDVWAGKVNDEKIGQGIWPDFEKKAFSEVFTKIGQFIVRGRKFELRLAIANSTIAKITKQKETDPRLQAIERITETLADGLPASGVDARRGQYRLFELPGVRLQLARESIRAKIHNQRVMLMRNGDVPERVLKLMVNFRDATESARDLLELLGIEGSAAALYFEQFESMLKQRDDWKFDWRGRNRRPPRDPVNALLSLGYSMLAKELTGVCHSVGLDPFLGFMHQPRYGRPALALDLMEEFRPLIADSVAISLINRGELGPEDFIRSANGTFLNDRGRKAFWEAWFRRLDAEVSHPEFSYKMAYRRMLEVQGRQLWRFVRGEAAAYHGFTTR